jgi:hypothetical protein
LPSQSEAIISIKELVESKNNNLVLCNTSTQNQYVLRYSQKPREQGSFDQMVNIALRASDLQIGPKVHKYNSEHILMDYVQNIKWPPIIMYRFCIMKLSKF